MSLEKTGWEQMVHPVWITVEVCKCEHSSIRAIYTQPCMMRGAGGTGSAQDYLEQGTHPDVLAASLQGSFCLSLLHSLQ